MRMLGKMKVGVIRTTAVHLASMDMVIRVRLCVEKEIESSTGTHEHKTRW